METETKIKIQNEIIVLLNKDNSSECTFHFEIVNLGLKEEESTSENKIQLLLISHNPKCNNNFLLCDVSDKTEELCYIKMLDFIKELPRSKDIVHYRLEWYHKKKVNQMEVSHFFGHSPFDALRKLYSLGNKDQIIFQSMSVRPIA